LLNNTPKSRPNPAGAPHRQLSRHLQPIRTLQRAVSQLPKPSAHRFL